MSADRPISVVVPVHNATAWLPETLASLLHPASERLLLEVIVVDDGSTDHPEDVVSRVLGGRGLSVFTVRNSTPIGPSASRNLGWRRSRGEWIQFLDADDLLSPAKLPAAMAAATQAGAEAAVVHSPWADWRLHGDEWQSGAVRHPQLGDQPLQTLLTADGFIQIGATLWRRTWLEQVNGFDPSLTLIEDVDLMLRTVMAGGRFVAVEANEPHFWYRRRSGSLSDTASETFVDACVRNAKFVETYWVERGELTATRREFLASIYHGLALMVSASPQRFNALVDHLLELDPAFIPAPPSRLRWLAGRIGYRRAERCAAPLRRLKQRLTLQSLH